VLVLDLEAPPAKLRGLLSRWCLEVRAGLYVGDLNARARELIWDQVVKLANKATSAVMIYSKRGTQGFAFRTLGPNRREPVDVEGMLLVRFHPEDETKKKKKDKAVQIEENTLQQQALAALPEVKSTQEVRMLPTLIEGLENEGEAEA
jgi:CRISPR-associated protein Cas2